MLESLTIRNYAIIDEMTTGFSGGLNIITGETGAGKSIVVDALVLVLGARASSEMIRAGERSLEVTGVFSLPPAFPRELLTFDLEDEPLILRREVRADGNNRCFINDNPVTLRLLRDIGDRLVDFHGQHDHQSLLVVSEHVKFLDGFGGLVALAEDVKGHFRALHTLRRELKTLKDRIESSARDRELRMFQIDELDAADPQPNEDVELENSIRRLSRAGELKSLGMRIFQELSDAEGSVSSRLGHLASEVEDAARADESLLPQSGQFNTLVDMVEETAGFFRGYAEDVEDDPALLAELDERLSLIEKLKKKYGPTLDDVMAFRDRLKQERDGEEESGERIGVLEAQIVEAERVLLSAVRDLTARRGKAAPLLAKEVEAHLAELGMSGARLVVSIEPLDEGELVMDGDESCRIGENGCDSVEFMMSANPGEPPKPLVKVASGGEISRVMLSLKLALSDVTSVPSMVFDEIDVGVSGRVGEAIGKKLKELTGQRQAIVITHLPQIAAMGDRHYSARKRMVGERTLAGLVELDDDMREHELASLLSGESLSDTALAHAREMMNKFNGRKVKG